MSSAHQVCQSIRMCHMGSPGALEELDDIGDTTDRAWILHHRHLLQDCLGQRGKLALMHPHVAQAHRTAQFADETAYCVDGGPGRLPCGHLARLQPCGLGHQRQSVSSHRPVELHSMREHDARCLSMRHMAMAAELMPNRMADASAHGGEANDRHPGPQLTM